jgi:hypothetical protein
MSFEEQLERAQADGRMSPGDADEVRHFASFLGALGAAGVPAGNRNRTDEQRQAFSRIYAEHYPEDYAREVARERRCTITLDVAYGNGIPIAITRGELVHITKLAHDDPPAAEALARRWATEPGRVRYGHPTTSPGSPAGPDDEGGAQP